MVIGGIQGMADTWCSFGGVLMMMSKYASLDTFPEETGFNACGVGLWRWVLPGLKRKGRSKISFA